jgi:hypothetical protein
MVAMPMGFPGVGQPIARGESAITALAVAPNNTIYGLTSGARTHVFVGMLHGATGFVHDLGVVDGATEGVAVGLGADDLVYACVNTPAGGRIVRLPQTQVPYDCLQEWVLSREPIEHVLDLPANTSIVHALFDAAGLTAFLLAADGTLLAVDLAAASVRTVAQTAEFGRTGLVITLDDRGVIYGTGFLGRIWQYDPVADAFEVWEQSISCGAGRATYNRVSAWAFDAPSRTLYAASLADGTLCAVDLAQRRVRSLGQVESMQPIHAMATTPDGRLYGVTGDADGVGRLFLFDPQGPELRELGICVSVLGARVYGFTFRSAALWRDGALIFGEADAISHLWVYFPALASAYGPRRPLA